MNETTPSNLDTTDSSAAWDPSTVKILCVDDEPNVLSALRRMFTLEGCAITIADGGGAALQAMASETFDVIISDMQMPEMNGAQLLEQVRLQWPHTMRILLTGTADLANAVAGINQVNVKEKIGLNFATSLRAFLRQDPDILMVGEIRDHETADIVMKASQTGHLVLSTLHTQDAPSALVRLRNMGVAAYNLASSISLISAQRLVRRLCVHCRTPIRVSSQSLKELGFQSFTHQAAPQHHFYSAQGCSQCHKGYWGRIGLFQVMPMTAALQHLILHNASGHELTAQAEKEGINTLRHAGLLQASMGTTSLSEVLAHTDVT